MVHPDGIPPEEQPEQADKGLASQGNPAPKAAQVRKGYTFLFKYVLVGDSGVGKSALLKRYTDDIFESSQYYTIGVDFNIKTLSLPSGDEIKLQMWDTAGQERYRNITSSYYRGCHGIIIIYDVNQKETFENVRLWLREVQRYCNNDTIISIMGNKADVAHDSGDDFYGPEQVQQLLKEAYGESQESSDDPKVFGTYLVSAKSGEGVNKAFQAITEELVTQKLNERNPLRGGGHKKRGDSLGHDTVNLQQPFNKPKSRCC